MFDNIRFKLTSHIFISIRKNSGLWNNVEHGLDIFRKKTNNKCFKVQKNDCQKLQHKYLGKSKKMLCTSEFSKYAISNISRLALRIELKLSGSIGRREINLNFMTWGGLEAIKKTICVSRLSKQNICNISATSKGMEFQVARSSSFQAAIGPTTLCWG